MPCYILNDQRVPVPVSDIRPLLDLYNGPPRRWLVGLDHVAEGIFIRTFFIGTGVSDDDPEPRFFVTTIITDYGEKWLWEIRYSTWEAAATGHKFVVAAETERYFAATIHD